MYTQYDLNICNPWKAIKNEKGFKLSHFILEVQMDIFILYMCILHIHALLNVYSVGDKPLGFTELKT